MRVLIATAYRSVVGGVETYLRRLVPLLVEAGIDVALLFEEQSHASDWTVDRVDIPVPFWCISDIGEATALNAVKEYSPDVVFSHGLRNAAIEDLLVSSFPTVLYAHNYAGTCVSGKKWHTWPETVACTRTMGCGCLLLNYPRGCGIRNPISLIRSFRSAVQRGALLQRYRAVVVASEHMRNEFSRHGVAADRLHVLALPAAFEREAAPPRRSGWTNNVLFVGRISKQKGLQFLASSIGLVSQNLDRSLRLVIAGEGPYLTDLQRLTTRLRLSVEYHGWVDDSARLRLMRNADVLAVPSVWPEPFGLVGVEGGSVGLPAVAFDVGGIREWLLPAETGEIAPATPPTAQGLAAALTRVLESPEHHATLCNGAWLRAGFFTEKAHIDALQSLLVGVANAA